MANQYLKVPYYKQRRPHLKFYWLTLLAHKRLILFFFKFFKKVKICFLCLVYFPYKYVVNEKLSCELQLPKLKRIKQFKNIFHLSKHYFWRAIQISKTVVISLYWWLIGENYKNL